MIVSWNTREVLLECLASLYAQEGIDRTEVVVVDNASTDGSADAVRAAFPGVTLIQSPSNQGFARASNLGIMATAGEYVCLVNSDVELLEGCLQKLTAFMDCDRGVGVAGPRILNPDRTVQNSCRKFPSLWNNLCLALGLNRIFTRSPVFSGEHMRYFRHDRQVDVDYLAGCFLIVRRDALLQAGLLDERYFMYQEEVDWCKQFRTRGWRVTFFPEAEAIHRHAASSSKDPVRFALARQESVMKYWRKHHGLASRWALRSILVLNRLLRLAGRSVLLLVRRSGQEGMKAKLREDWTCLRFLLRRDA